MESGQAATVERPAGGIPVALNGVLAVFHAALNLYQFFILPLSLLPRDRSWAWTLVPLALLTNPFWSLIHEAIHDLFHPARPVNGAAGRALSILFGAPFRILRLSHLLHHKLNRTPIEGTEFYERGRQNLAGAAASYYFQIFGGLYLMEIVSPLLFFLPRAAIRRFRDRFVKAQSVSGILMQNWSQDEAVREIRLDGLLILAWMGLSLACYGDDWPLFLGILAARGFLISFLDNVYHYRTPVGEMFYARNLWLPPPAARVLLNFNFHGIHHKNPAIPWIRLPALFRRDAQRFEGNYFVAAAGQLAGPVALQDLPGGR